MPFRRFVIAAIIFTVRSSAQIVGVTAVFTIILHDAPHEPKATLDATITTDPRDSNVTVLSFTMTPCNAEVVITSDSAVQLADDQYRVVYGDVVTVHIIYDGESKMCPPALGNNSQQLTTSFEIVPSLVGTLIRLDDCDQFMLEDEGEPCRSRTLNMEYIEICPANPIEESIAFRNCNETAAGATHQLRDDESAMIAVIVSVILAALVGGAIIAATIIMCCKRRNSKINSDTQIERHFGSESVRSSRYDHYPRRIDNWEIDRGSIHVIEGAPLGHGAFGVVLLGRIAGFSPFALPCLSPLEIAVRCRDQKSVAVKTLSDSADSAAHASFLSEIKLMKSIGYHARLVNLLACVTASDPPYLVMEYCTHGDLQQFLRTRREYMLSVILRGGDSEGEKQEKKSLSHSHDSMLITPKQQICFSVQIASAMEYLSQRGFVHRDVAARNVLVDENVSCKLGDFGLCRKVGKDMDYYIGKGGRLPLKWMAPEAISDYRFSVSSDIWSFGVLLYEMFTLGGSPYPDCPAAQLLSSLLAGYRMEKPVNCPDTVYALMLECWDVEAKQRPSFAEMRKRLALVLEEESLDDDYYLRLEAHNNYCPMKL